MSPRIIVGAISAFYGVCVLAPRHEFSDAVLRAIAALGAAVTVCPDHVPQSFDVWPPEPKERDR